VTRRPTRISETSRYLKSFLPIVILAACTAPGSASYSSGNDMSSQQGQIAQGRQLVLDHGCADCHSMGVPSPVSPGFLAGMSTVDQEFQIGPFKTRPRNLTPDNATGLDITTEQGMRPVRWEEWLELPIREWDAASKHPRRCRRARTIGVARRDRGHRRHRLSKAAASSLAAHERAFSATD